MRHRPHLLIEGSWLGTELAVPKATSRHLTTVLRVSEGTAVTYTDGQGVSGLGVWNGDSLERGDEWPVERSKPIVKLAVAPPKSKDRQRFIVEKAQELGVTQLLWLSTDHGQVRPPPDAKSRAWAHTALEQSRGSWLTKITDAATLADLSDPVVLDAGAATSLAAIDPGPDITLAIGPEGGFSDAELASAGTLVSFPTNTLRTETAVIVAVATVLRS